MGDRAGDSFRGWVYALGLCGGCVGVVGVLEFALFDVFLGAYSGCSGCLGARWMACISNWPSVGAGVGWWMAGVQGGGERGL